MSMELLMGNEAIALGAIAAGVNVMCGYPGTPSTEILETAAKRNPGDVYVEWSVNEKAALEVAAGAAYAGARVLVTMKQVGLNVASDPLMSLAYVGVKGGMVVVSADDPGPISSQTEQDTRHFAQFAKLPVFDPATPEQAYAIIADAFELSEKLGTPVLFRPTTRVCHACSSINVKPRLEAHKPEGFVKDTMRWVIFPRTSYLNHLKIEKRNRELGDTLSNYHFNKLSGDPAARKAIVTGGVSTVYVREAVKALGEPVKVLQIATPHPFPEKLALAMLDGVDEVLVVEELDPVLEQALLLLCGKQKLKKTILGKGTDSVQLAGENSVESVKKAVAAFLGVKLGEQAPAQDVPALPVRPPVLCAGCPHRASFYAVKRAAKGRKAVFCGDIGCYTLGNAKPLNMVDTCLCMGADVTIAQGLSRVDKDTLHFSFIGDSTFFASGITGVVNAVYNQAEQILVVLDNSTTAMTGHQPHPGTGKTMMGEVSQKIDIAKVLLAIGVTEVVTADPLKLDDAINAVKHLMDGHGVRAVIFRSPCVAVSKPSAPLRIDPVKCVGCNRCVNELGCPAIFKADGKPVIEEGLCFGCGLCAQVCATKAIALKGGER